MGQILQAKCRICNHETTFKFGGGRFNYLEYCPVPAINLENGNFENVNYLIEKNNSKYDYYFNSNLKGKSETGKVFRNFDFLLNEFNNYCPNCKQYTFDFISKLMFD